MEKTPSTFPGGKPLIGVLPDLQRNPLKVMERAVLSHGPVTKLPLPTLDAYVLGTRQLAEHVLVTNVKNYVKQTRGYDMLRIALGNGLVTSEGNFWKRQRRIAQPAFHRERLAGFGEVMTRAASEMVDAWQPGAPFDFAHEMMRCTLRIVGETLLSSDVTNDADGVGQALTVALEHLIHRTLHPLAAPEWVPTGENRAFKKALQKLDDVVLGVIAERRTGGVQKNDLLAMLMESRDPETGEGMTDAQLRDEVMTIFLAGHETTANVLSWAMLLLGTHSQVEAKLLQEIDTVLQGRAPTMADVGRLPYSLHVIKEAMRLYPPVWTLGRTVVEDEVVDGWRLKKGALVFVSPWALHRHPEYWEAPNEFRPERWTVDDPRRAHGAYLPFSMGQRKCIGDSFAIVEAQLVLVTILQRMQMKLVADQSFEPEPLITLRPKNGVMVMVSKRNGG
ncbi:MAG: cytochrome P450 [Archangium sp.]